MESIPTDPISEAAPDLAVLDLVMPVMGGLESIHGIRRNRQARGLARLPVIVVSASANEEDLAESFAAGADAFLLKPVSPRALATVLGETVRAPLAAT